MFLCRYVLVFTDKLNTTLSDYAGIHITRSGLIVYVQNIMKIRKETTVRIFNLAKYEIYCQKKQELLDFIQEQMAIWGDYTEIPEPVQEFIDKELIVLGKFRKKINIPHGKSSDFSL